MTRLIVVPDDEPQGEPSRAYPFRLVRPGEPVWAAGGLLHTVRPDRAVTGCGITLPDLTRLARACDFPGHRLCPHRECFGDPS